jgi:hypothetical protein
VKASQKEDDEEMGSTQSSAPVETIAHHQQPCHQWQHSANLLCSSFPLAVILSFQALLRICTGLEFIMQGASISILWTLFRI